MKMRFPAHRQLLALALAALSFAQAPEKRVAPPGRARRLALVIGNQDYTTGRLANTVHDAEIVAAALQAAGFAARDITLLRNLRDVEMRNAVRQFTGSVRAGDMVFVYYSGHGVEIRGSNYLLPVNLPADATEDWAEDEAVSAQKLLDSLERAEARVRVLVLDACRDNPLRPRGKSVKGGLAGMEGAGALVLFATAAGRTARDNGLFARELASTIPKPGISLDDAFKLVARDVIRLTNRAQVPAIYGLLEEDVVLVESPPEAPAVTSRVREAGDTRVNAKDGLTYVWIPPGTFTMGCPPGDSCATGESPAHTVTISTGFWIGQTTVTVGAWKKYRLATGTAALTQGDGQVKLNEAAGDDTIPALGVNWDAARAFCEWSGGRLPTEAQWEYAARAGSPATRYGDLDRIAWSADISGSQRIDSAQIWREDHPNYKRRLDENGNRPHPVGQKEPNAWHLYDMLGNAWQWMADWYSSEYYSHSEKSDPAGPPSGDNKTLRGGSWDDIPSFARASERYNFSRSFGGSDYGVRCVQQ